MCPEQFVMKQAYELAYFGWKS